MLVQHQAGDEVIQVNRPVRLTHQLALQHKICRAQCQGVAQCHAEFLHQPRIHPHRTGSGLKLAVLDAVGKLHAQLAPQRIARTHGFKRG